MSPGGRPIPRGVPYDPAMGEVPPEHLNVRASDADRDSTVNRLRDAAGEGQLTLEELTHRIEAAANAVMRSDLELLTCDLPAAAADGVATQSDGVHGLGD